MSEKITFEVEEVQVPGDQVELWEVVKFHETPFPESAKSWKRIRFRLSRYGFRYTPQTKTFKRLTVTLPAEALLEPDQLELAEV